MPVKSIHFQQQLSVPGIVINAVSHSQRKFQLMKSRQLACPRQSFEVGGRLQLSSAPSTSMDISTNALSILPRIDHFCICHSLFMTSFMKGLFMNFKRGYVAPRATDIYLKYRSIIIIMYKKFWFSKKWSLGKIKSALGKKRETFSI